MVLFATKARKQIALPIERNVQQCTRGVETCTALPKNDARSVPRSSQLLLLASMKCRACHAEMQGVDMGRTHPANRKVGKAMYRRHAVPAGSRSLTSWHAGRKACTRVERLARERHQFIRVRHVGTSMVAGKWPRKRHRRYRVIRNRPAMVFSRWKAKKNHDHPLDTGNMQVHQRIAGN